jgi:hypothetical protein
MHDDCNYKKQAERDYEKFHSLRGANSSKVIRLRAVPTSMALAKDQRIVPEALQFAQNPSSQ